SGPFPGAGQSLAERQEMNLLKSTIRSLLEVQVGQKKVHHHAGWTPGSIAMPLQHVPKRNYILRIFERVIIVRIFTQMNSAGAKLLVPFTVAHPHAAPIIALQENQGTTEAQSFRRPRGFPTQHRPHPIQHWAVASGWCKIIISQPPS